MKEDFEFFWDGPFSQWHPSPFALSGMKFNRAEQFMMFCKAMFFNDIETARAVMKSNSPKEQKALGRQTKGFNVDKWTNVARDIVYAGSYCKYTQDKDLLAILNETGNKTLVEASPYDKIWGIGLAEGDPKTLDRNTWQGKNWLGEVLTKVKKDIAENTPNQEALKLCEDLVGKYR